MLKLLSSGLVVFAGLASAPATVSPLQFSQPPRPARTRAWMQFAGFSKNGLPGPRVFASVSGCRR